MATNMSQILGQVLNARNNYGAPDSFKNKVRVKVEDIGDEVITIDEVIILTKLKKDDDGNIVKSKDGTKDIYQPFAYVSFNVDKYFSTKSAIMIEQFVTISGVEIPRYEKAEIPVKGVKGITAKIGSEKVKYANKQFYPQPVLVDAE